MSPSRPPKLAASRSAAGRASRIRRPSRAAGVRDDAVVMSSLLTALGVPTLRTVLPGPGVAVVTSLAVVAGWPAALRASGGVVLGVVAWQAVLVALGLQVAAGAR